MAFTDNLGLIEPTPGDPAVANAWGTLLNTDMALIDAAVAGILPLSVAGNTNVVLTSTNGVPNQARYGMFNFTGVLTGNIDILWPSAKTFLFAVKNSTSGAFSLALGVNDGAGAPVGTTATVPQGSVGLFYSDGTNVAIIGIISGTAGLLAGSNDWSGANVFGGAQNLRLDAGDADSHPVAFMNTTASSPYSGRISWGTGAAPVLAEGEIYLQTA